ncbi:hypothetical protein GCM10008967_09070 [Bacillus carboniphilus]|uniref:Cell division protein DivIC n=1 Tax=Bacillus carboniphilus TaxID=86663 RepID=A0ABN0VYQ8_9BACI
MGRRSSREKVTTIHEQYVQEKAVYSEQNATKRKYLVRRLTAFLLLATMITGYLISSLFSQASAIDEKKSKLNKLQNDLEELKEEQVVLEEQIQMLNDDEYLGQLARKYYYLSDEKEIIFALPEDEEEEEEENTSN